MMQAFDSICPKLAARECRWIIGDVTRPDRTGVRTALREFYCVDLACECRRCIIQVTSEAGAIQATIGYAFDPEADLRGPYLDPLLPQGRSAQTWLRFHIDYFDEEPDYPHRLEQHYQLARQVANGQRREEDCPRWDLPTQSSQREHHSRFDATPPARQEPQRNQSVLPPQVLVPLVEQFARQNNIEIRDERDEELVAAMLAERLLQVSRSEKPVLPDEYRAYNREERRRMKKASRRT